MHLVKGSLFSLQPKGVMPPILQTFYMIPVSIHCQKSLEKSSTVNITLPQIFSITSGFYFLHSLEKFNMSDIFSAVTFAIEKFRTFRIIVMSILVGCTGMVYMIIISNCPLPLVLDNPPCQ